jgi:hypothetical protein
MKKWDWARWPMPVMRPSVLSDDGQYEQIQVTLKINYHEQVFNNSIGGNANVRIGILYAGMGNYCHGGSHDHCGNHYREDRGGRVAD